MRGTLLVLAAVLSLSATGAHAQMRGNDTGGIIPWSCENEAAARDIAAEHCAGYRKYPRITGVNRGYGNYIGFNCLWNPRQAPFALPRVGTRSYCGHPRKMWVKGLEVRG